MATKTCGELYKDIATWALANYDGLALFAAGSIAGQAEKVYLGACPGCMIRPGAVWEPFAWTLIQHIGEVYGLWVERLDYGETREFWLLRWNDAETYARFYGLFSAARQDMYAWTAEQWATWHTVRAQLCGIPERHIDPHYHLRVGYQQVCEPGLPEETL